MIKGIKRKVFREFVSGKLDPFFKDSESIVLVLGTERQIEYCNPAAGKLLDCKKNNLLGKEINQILTKKSLQIFDKYFNDIEKINYNGMELEITDNSGNQINVRFNASQIKDNMMFGTLMIGEEIEELSSRNAIVEKEEAIFSEFIDDSPYGIVLFDDKGNLRKINKCFTAITGYNGSDLKEIDTWFQKAYPDKKYRDFVVKDWLRYKNIENYPRIFDVTCKSGEVKKIEFRFQIFNKDRSLIYISDITERLQKQDSIRENIKELSRKKFQIERSNIQLKEVNKKLKDSESKLSKLNQMKDKFFSILAHDLRSPFSALLSLANLAESDFDNFDSKTLNGIIKNINSSAKNFYNLLENLLTWTRISSERMDFEPADIELSEIVKEIVNLLNPNAVDKQIEIVNEIEEERYCYADPNMLRRIIQNLLSNAIKFTFKKGKVIIFAEELSGYFRVSVKDTGTGIDEDSLKNLFRIDIRQSKKGTNNESGTGLGLILCKELVEKNGGTISVTSKINVGSQFSFTVKQSNKI